MSSRNYVVGAVTDKMRAAVAKGDFLDAQNMEAFISSLEDMTDEEYAEISSLETPGLIS